MFYFLRNFERQKLRLRKAKKLFYNANADAEMPMPIFPNGLLKPVLVIQKNEKAYSEPCQTSKMELLVKIVDGGCQLAKFVKSSILDV